MSERLAWGDSPYDSKTPAMVVHDYAKVRGDLTEQYARDQLAEWIERYAEAQVEARLAAVRALAERWANEASEREPDDQILTAGAAGMVLRALGDDA